MARLPRRASRAIGCIVSVFPKNNEKISVNHHSSIWHSLGLVGKGRILWSFAKGEYPGRNQVCRAKRPRG